MLGGLGLKARASTADAHDARAFGAGQHQLMLMMLGRLGCESPGPALMLMMLGGLGVEIQGKHQLMLMMLGRLGLKARASTTDAQDACGKPGQAPADAHDARGFGLESPGQHH